VETLAELDAEPLAPELLVDPKPPVEPVVLLEAGALAPEPIVDEEPTAKPLAPLEAEALGPLSVAPVVLRPCCGAPASTSYGALPSSRALLPHPSTTPKTANAAIGRRTHRFFLGGTTFVRLANPVEGLPLPTTSASIPMARCYPASRHNRKDRHAAAAPLSAGRIRHKESHDPNPFTRSAWRFVAAIRRYDKRSPQRNIRPSSGETAMATSSEPSRRDGARRAAHATVPGADLGTGP
jgi:hypothetical protein